MPWDEGSSRAVRQGECKRRGEVIWQYLTVIVQLLREKLSERLVLDVPILGENPIQNNSKVHEHEVIAKHGARIKVLCSPQLLSCLVKRT